MKFKNEELKKCYELAKKAGYTVYTSQKKDQTISYFNIAGKEGIGYIQAGDFGRVLYSTVHKPNTQCGTGFRINNEEEEASLKRIKDTFAFCPDWVISKRDIEAVKKYKDWEDYLKNPLNQILSYKKI